MSDISTNSSSNTFLTTFGGRDAAGLYEPGVDNVAMARTGSEGPGPVFAAVTAVVSMPENAAREDLERWHQWQLHGVRHLPQPCCHLCGVNRDILCSSRYVIFIFYFI